RSGILLNRLLESSLIFKGFSRLPTWLSALPLALSMEAHYREQILSGNPSPAIKLQKGHFFSYSYPTTAFIQTYPQKPVPDC
ncbi:hypothetical protein, partial [Aeromonas veronii]|uniref:hypothetical protein n=1 Tax=Aeromonas veronii TaxID=654 RepID=UPI001BD045C7